MPDRAAGTVAATSVGGRLALASDVRAERRIFARHDLCWLHCAGDQPMPSLSVSTIDLRPPRFDVEVRNAQAVVRRWIADGRPLVVTRQSARHASGRRQLAMCRARPMAPRRIAVEVSAKVIKVVTRPVMLPDAICAAPGEWQAALNALDQSFAAIGLAARVFGSLAWQALAGLPYLHARSDIDLIVDLPGETWRTAFTPEGRLSDVFASLVTLIDAAPFRCDCELRLDHDVACSLAEVRGPSRQVMVKRNDHSTLIARAALRELPS